MEKEMERMESSNQLFVEQGMRENDEKRARDMVGRKGVRS